MSRLKEVDIRSLVVGNEYYDNRNRETLLRFVGYHPNGPDFEPVVEPEEYKYLRNPETGMINFGWSAGSFYVEE